jgi:tetratricopeptide (TPR) repeat protein
MTTKRTQPSLAELTGRMLSRDAVTRVDSTELEVEPHEVLNGFRTDPRTSYNDALLPLTLIGVKDVPSSLPPEWSAYTLADLGTLAVPMAAGHFPQRVQDLNALFSLANPTNTAIARQESAANFSNLRTWVKASASVEKMKWLARGIGYVLGEEQKSSTESTPAAYNERATVAWIAGQHQEALKTWLEMPDSPVASFNRGMALLFTGQVQQAIPHLQIATANIPDSSGWSHLAHLYLAVANGRN